MRREVGHGLIDWAWFFWDRHLTGSKAWGGGSEMVPFERAMLVFYRLSIVTIALSLTIQPQFAIECLRRSNQQTVGHFGAKFGEEGVINVSLILTQSGTDMDGAVVCERDRVDTFCCLSTMHERDRQTDRGTSIPIGEIAFQRCYIANGRTTHLPVQSISVSYWSKRFASSGSFSVRRAV